MRIEQVRVCTMKMALQGHSLLVTIMMDCVFSYGEICRYARQNTLLIHNARSQDGVYNQFASLQDGRLKEGDQYTPWLQSR